MKFRSISKDRKPSVIILSYNTRQLLLTCLTSVMAESHRWGKSVETIVVDNGSMDGSARAVHEQFPEVTVIECPENLGFARGNNLGILASSGDPVVILNSDTVLMSGFFRAVEEKLRGEDGIGILAPRLLNPDGTLQISAYHNYPDPLVEIFGYTPIGAVARRLFPGINYPFRYELTPEEHTSRREVSHVKGACLIMRRSMLNEVGGFDEDFFLYREETDLCKRARDSGWKIVYTPDIHVCHHHKASSRALSDQGLTHRLTSHYLYLEKHHSRAARALAYASFTMYALVMMSLTAGIGILHFGQASAHPSYFARILTWHLRNPGRCLR